MDNNQLQMELELSKRIEKLEVVAEDYYQTNIMDYLHIYSVHGVCQQNVQRLFHHLQLMEVLAGYDRLPYLILSPLFRCGCCPNRDFRYYCYSNCYFRHFELF